MNKIFPPEIINNSTQSHFVDNSTKSSIIYILVIVFIIAGFVLLPFISVDITNQTRGIVRTQSENTQLQLAVYGEVETVSFIENQTVKCGDVLLTLKTDKTDEQIAEHKRDVAENNLFISDLQILIKGNSKPVTAKYRSEYVQYQTKIEEHTIELKLIQHEYSLKKELFNKKVIPEIEFLHQKNSYDIAVSRFKLMKKQFQNGWQSELTRLILENKDLQSAVIQLQNDKRLYKITAPVSGVITNVAGIKKGSFIAPNQSVGQISPNEDMLVECYVSPSDIGFIKQKQKVRFQFDAFNYNQWGMACGEVKEISTDIYTNNEKPFFKVRCKLDTEYLQLKNGYKGYLKKGMTLTARFYLTKRTLWQLLFDKVDDWMNPKLMTNM